MTPEAKEFQLNVIQRIRERMFSGRYITMRMATTIQETDIENAPDADAPRVMFWRDMMILGSVLLPGPATHAHYLDDADRRALILHEVLISPRDFIHACHVATWDFLLAGAGRRAGELQIPRRFYAVNKASDFGWGVTAIPTQEEKDAEDSQVPADAVTLPDFLNVTDSMRYTAIGA